MSSRKVKIVVLSIIAIFIIGFYTNSNAATETMEFFKGELPIEGGKLNPFGNHYTCIQRHGSLKPTLTRETLGTYKVGDTTSSWCSACDDDPDKPWENVLKTAYYEVGDKIDQYEYQDVAYIIADSEEKNSLLSAELRDAIWSTPLNSGTTVGANGLGQEAAAYKEFFERTHDGTTDIFMSLVHDNTKVSKVQVGVNQEEQTYTIGPFKIEYPEGGFQDKNFSYINKIEAVTNTGTLPVEVLNISGNINKNGNTINTPKSNEEFYIRFKSTSATNVSVKATFTYLEHCDATMFEVNGTYMNWRWEKKENGVHTHDETVYEHFDGPCGEEWCDWIEAHDHQIGETKKTDYKVYEYELVKESAGRIQELMKYQGGSKIWKKNQYIISSGIDLTMDIAGYVFLDQDTGKVNAGDNILGSGEALAGVEVTLFDADGNQVSASGVLPHVHIGDKNHGGDCYKQPVYHTHKEKCYTYNHTHIGNSVQGGNGTCYQLPVYHVHDYTCRNSAGRYLCGRTESSVEFYKLTCNKKVTRTLICGKKVGKTIDKYKLTCNLEQGESYSATSTRLTDGNGHYEFSKLNAMKKYYVKFTYNGMLYTNVDYNDGGSNNASKSTESGQGHDTNRQTFNNQFAEISSYPSNYEVVNKYFKDNVYTIKNGKYYNKVYLQEEIADIFKALSAEVVNNGGNVSVACNTIVNQFKDIPEIKQKIQYAADCRISAYSVKQYPVKDIFSLKDKFEINNVKFLKIYNVTTDCQRYVNLGIKARPTFDIALYKNVFNAVLNINGKTENYTYDARKDWKGEGFSFGVSETDYLNQLRAKYISGTNTNLQTKEVRNEGEYVHEFRTEEIINGNNQNTAINDTNLYDENKNYAWRDINHSLSDADKLQIHVTYKLAIRNQSDVVGSVTEIVDYYDSHYQFEKAYVGDKDGNEIQGTKVEASETSTYGIGTQFAANGEWTVENQKRSYKTIYLRPTEKKLYSDDKEQYIYVTFGLINPEATLVDAGLPDGKKLYTYNLAEINGYKTYGTSADYKKNPNNTASMGLVDRDSNPGNLNPAAYVMGKSPLEDDESKAPAYVYSHRNSRTLEGTVFEDMLSEVSGNKAPASKDENEVKVNTTRFGSGTIDDGDKKVQGVKVELVEVKNGQLIVRQTTYTDKNGWYGFGAFLPGDYTIRFTYGAEDKTALTISSQYTQGLNDTSYNGQDYESTIYGVKTGDANTEIRLDTPNYRTDSSLISVYQTNYDNRNSEESRELLSITDTTGIDKYTKFNKQENGSLVETPYYWYTQDDKLSDARDDAYRRDLVTAYSKSEYGKEITNHKAEVFNSYINQKALREAESKDNNFNEFTQAQPMDEAVDTEAKNRELVNELERRTYMYAYTPEIEVEVEYTTEQIAGNMASDKYTYKIAGVDFGIVERPRSQLVIDQDVKHIKVTASDGSSLFDTEKGVNNLQWIAKGDTSKYDKNELINIILDDELLSGSKLEVTYNITVINNSEVATGTTRAKTIINYVANNLNFDLADNNGLWEAVKKEDIQTTSRSTYINNSVNKNNVKLVDLSTQTTVLKATTNNPLTKALNPKESATVTLTLKKTLSAESSSDDLSYSNLTEIVEIDNEYGRYDYGAIPGNQSLEEQPREHDTSGASRYDEIDKDYQPDGEIIITPPTGSKYIYYVLGTTAMLILALGIILIKKFVIRKK